MNKKKYIIFGIFVILFLILFNDFLNFQKKHNIVIPKDEKTCLAKNGRWKKVGISPRETCNLKTTDYKKDCTDHSQCEGDCIANLTKEESDKGMRGTLFSFRHGQCSEWVTVYGCRGYISHSWVKFVCLD